MIVSHCPFRAFQKFSARQLVDLALNNRTNTVTMQQFYQLCPSLLQQVLVASEGSFRAQDVDVEDTERKEADISTAASAIQSE